MKCLECNNDFTPRQQSQKHCSNFCYGRTYRKENKDKERLRKIEYYNNNREKVLNKSKEYHRLNKTKRNDYERNRENYDVNFKLRKRLRSRIRCALINQSGVKAYSSVELLGCSIKECREYLESLFLENMSWDNYGEWEIDHIIPCDSFDLTKEEEQKRCFHFSNLQPLWWRDNRTKGNKV
jgi:hypothetical protein